MVTIKDENKWNLAIKQFGDEPETPEDWKVITELYRKLGGKITIKRNESIYKCMTSMQEGINDDLKSFLSKWIKNPIVLGIALYFFGHQLKKYIK